MMVVVTPLKLLQSMPEHKQVRTARETMEVFVPLAEILRVQAVKEELEDLCFQVLDRPTYESMREMITHRRLALESTRFGKSKLSFQQVRDGMNGHTIKMLKLKKYGFVTFLMCLLFRLSLSISLIEYMQHWGSPYMSASRPNHCTR